jgi:hypothetical protein
MQNKSYTNKEGLIAKSCGYVGAGLFFSTVASAVGGSILGSSFGLVSLVGGGILSLPFLAIQLTLDYLKKENKMSAERVDFFRNLASLSYVAAAAPLGACILGQALLPALLASGIGSVIFIGAIVLIGMAFKAVDKLKELKECPQHTSLKV